MWTPQMPKDSSSGADELSIWSSANKSNTNKENFSFKCIASCILRRWSGSFYKENNFEVEMEKDNSFILRLVTEPLGALFHT